jgi:hypothetical protein
VRGERREHQGKHGHRHGFHAVLLRRTTGV